MIDDNKNEADIVKSSVSNSNPNFDMISFYVDPQWCGVLFSVYWRNEKGYLYTGGTTPQLDPLVTTAFAEPLDADWITFAGSVGFEIYHLSSWAVVFDAAKVTGILLLLGFGSVVGYRILRYLWLSRFSDNSEPPSPSLKTHVAVSVNKDQLLEDVDNTDLNEVEGRYFGPDPTPTNHSLVSMLCMQLHKLAKSLSSIRKSDLNICLKSFEDFESSYLHRKNLNEYVHKNASDIRNNAKVSDRTCYATSQNPSRNSSVFPHCYEDVSDSSAHMRREGSFDSTCSEFSLDFTLPESCENINIINLDKLQQEIDKLKSNCEMMDEELEIIKCNRNLPGLSSLMEANISETNFASNEDGVQFHSTGSDVKQQNARACFAGLYSLTTIKNSSSDLSEFSDSGNKMVDSLESLDWDSPQPLVMRVTNPCSNMCDKIHAQPHDSNYTDTCKATITEREAEQKENVNEESFCWPKVSVGNVNSTSSDVDMTLELEWDEDDLVPNINDSDENYNSVDLTSMPPCLQLTPDSNTEINCLMFQHLQCQDNQYKLHAQNTTNGNNLQPDSQDWSNNDCIMNVSKCSKESGYLEWDEESEFSFQEVHGVSSVQSTPESDAPALLNSSDAIFMPNAEFVGSRMNVFKYALQVCQGNNKHGEILLKGFAEIPSLTGLQNLRLIHGDCYCVFRAAIFQGLLNHCPVPCGRSTFQFLSDAFNNFNFTWLQNWDFSTNLPYQGKEVLLGMRMCLHTLDNVMSVLSSREDAEDTLAMLLNSDRSLDVHIMEAVKLHILTQTIKFYQSYTKGGNIPEFVKFMFAHTSCRTPKEFMYKHLQNEGRSTDLNEVMSLLSFTLNMKMCVIRPALFGTDQFVSHFPRCNISSPHEVVLVENENCYSVLVK